MTHFQAIDLDAVLDEFESSLDFQDLAAVNISSTTTPTKNDLINNTEEEPPSAPPFPEDDAFEKFADMEHQNLLVDLQTLVII
jgi:hypothetical protein